MKTLALRYFGLRLLSLAGIALVVGHAGASLAQSQPAASQPPMTLAKAVALLESSGRRLNGSPNSYNDAGTIGKPRVTGMQYEVDFTGAYNSSMYAGTTVCTYAANPDPKIESHVMFMTGQAFPSSVELTCSKTNGRMVAWGSPEFTALFKSAWLTMRTLGAPETDAERIQFETALLAFQAKSVGPDVGEDVRMHKVLAEAAVRETRLWEAVEQFEKGLALAPWWPQGNFNVALVYAELKAYPRAIRYMQRYIKLVPDATNARAAQDKVYEWTGAAQRTLR